MLATISPTGRGTMALLGSLGASEGRGAGGVAVKAWASGPGASAGLSEAVETSPPMASPPMARRFWRSA